MTSLHVRPIAFNMAEAIRAAVARSPSCAESNMPAMRASLSMASATLAAGLGQLRFARHFALERGAHEETHLGIEKFRGELADMERAAVLDSESDPGVRATPRAGNNITTRHASPLTGFA